MNKDEIKHRSLTGRVVSAKNPKTVIVAIAHHYRHPLYRKTVARTRRLAAHNASLTLAVGDTVKIASCRPVSRTKHFVVVSKET